MAQTKVDFGRIDTEAGTNLFLVRGLRRLIGLTCAIVLALLWLLLGASPAYAAGTFLGYGNATLNDQDFSNQNLVGGTFVSAEMRGTNFSGSNLANAMLTKGNLLGANLKDTNLEGALLDRATLYKADLTNAVLTDATLSNSILDEAIITGADFTNAILDRYTVSQLCKRADGINPTTQVATRDSLECR